MISMIASVGKNMEIGSKNELIWRIPDDMKFFKNTTMEHIVVMGWNTYQSLPNKNLPGRTMIVLSRNNFDNNVEIVKNTNEIIDKYYSDKQEVFIIGGASIYKTFIEYTNNLYLTEINATYKDADTFFPKFNKDDYIDTILDEGKYIDKLLDEGKYQEIDYKIHKYTKKLSKYQ